MKTNTVLTLVVGMGIGALVGPFGLDLPFLPQGQDQLDGASLKTMLEGLGYEAKPLGKGFVIVERQDQWTISMHVLLSEDKNKIGINSNLGTVPELDSVEASRWRALLASNSQIDPTVFCFDDQEKRLYLHTSLDNRGMTPGIMRREIQYFTKNLKDTASLRNFTK